MHPVFHLPAYLAVARWVAGRRVVVFDPAGPAGPRLLRDAGAAMVLVVGDAVTSEPGIDARGQQGHELPLRDGSVDVVLCIERFRALDASARAGLLDEAARVLRPNGVFAAWAPQPDAPIFGRTQEDHAVDFYVLEESVSAAFPWVRMLAQMPWQGFSLAPLAEAEDDSDPRIELQETLHGSTGGASHYLVLGGHKRIDPGLVNACTMVPLPEGQVFDGASSDEVLDELETLREELSLRSARSVAAQNRTRELETQLEHLRGRADERASESQRELGEALDEARARAQEAKDAQLELRAELDRLHEERGRLVEELALLRESNSELGRKFEAAESSLAQGAAQAGERAKSERNDLAILTRTVSDHQEALKRVSDQLQGTRAKLEEGSARERALRGKLGGLEGERAELQRQLDVRVAEGEGARKLAARVEAELEVLRTRHSEQGDRLASKIEEASKLNGEVEVLRARLKEQSSSLQQTRTRAEELSASAAEGEHKGRMLAELAADRDRLREELSHRARQIETFEEKLWEGREALQREKLENVRLGGEVERLRELLARGRDVEKQRASELEALASELREVELDRVEIRASLRAREERLSQMLTEADALVGRSEDASVLKVRVESQRGDLEALRAKLDKSEHLHRQSSEQSQQRGAELEKVRDQYRQLERRAEERGDMAARLQTELDMRGLELEQSKENLKRITQEGEQLTRASTAAAEKLKKRDGDLNRTRSREAELSRRVFELEAALDKVKIGADEHTAAVLDLRKELEADTRFDEVREKAPRSSHVHVGTDDHALREELAAAQREIAGLREAALLSEEHGEILGADTAGLTGFRRLQLENEIRASEQERMLMELDAAEQKIWEMTDTSDRNAARFAASLAQLERQKERVDQLLDELEVTRSLLGAEQARTLEQERLLASERAKLARAGLGTEGFPRDEDPEVDEVFADLNPGKKMTPLGRPEPRQAPDASGVFALDEELERLVGREGIRPAPSHPPGVPSPVNDRGATSNHNAGTPLPPAKRSRVVVEEVDDDEWVDED